MRVRGLVAIILLFISATPALAQNWVELFNDMIPPEARKDRFVTRSVRLNLEKMASIHPEMLYYYMLYLRTRYAERNEDEPVVSLRALNAIERRYATHRNLWVQDQLDWLARQEANLEVRQAAEKYFLALQAQESNVATNEALVSVISDSNKMHFFVVQYFQPEQKHIYDARIDYHQQRQELENELVARKLSLMNEIRQSNKPLHDSKVKAFFRSPHLLARLNNTQTTLAAEFALMQARKRLSTEKLWYYPAGRPRLIVGGEIRQHDEFIGHRSASVPELFSGKGLMLTTRTPQRFVTVQLQFKLMKYRTSLSYLNLHFAFSLDKGAEQSTSFDDSLQNVVEERIDNKIFRRFEQSAQFTTGEFGMKTPKSYHFQISAPFWVP